MSDLIKKAKKTEDEVEAEVVRKTDEALKHKAEAEKEALKYKAAESKKKGRGEGPVTGTDPRN